MDADVDGGAASTSLAAVALRGLRISPLARADQLGREHGLADAAARRGGSRLRLSAMVKLTSALPRPSTQSTAEKGPARGHDDAAVNLRTLSEIRYGPCERGHGVKLDLACPRQRQRALLVRRTVKELEGPAGAKLRE